MRMSPVNDEEPKNIFPASITAALKANFKTEHYLGFKRLLISIAL